MGYQSDIKVKTGRTGASLAVVGVVSGRGRQQALWTCKYGDLVSSEAELGNCCVVPTRYCTRYAEGIRINGH